MNSRRDVLKSIAISTTALGIGAASSANADPQSDAKSTITLPPPISNADRGVRIVQAQALMQEQGLAGIIIEAGTSMRYFSDLAWRQSSRLTALVIPSAGDPVVITPAFEESKLRELMVMDMEVRTWNEHESPFALIGGVLDDRDVIGAIGLERTTRFFVAEGLKSDVPGREIVSASPVVSALRQIKTTRELDLMKAANAITMAAYREMYPQVAAGMTGGGHRRADARGDPRAWRYPGLHAGPGRGGERLSAWLEKGSYRVRRPGRADGLWLRRAWLQVRHFAHLGAWRGDCRTPPCLGHHAAGPVHCHADGPERHAHRGER